MSFAGWFGRGLRGCLLVAALASGGCGSDENEGNAPGDLDGGSSDAGSDAGEESPVICPSSALAPGDSTFELSHGGMTRSYQLHVPSGYSGQEGVPLVVNFHGYTSNATQQAGFSGMNAKADAAGFIVAYPEGLNNSWNAGTCCGVSATNKVDDVGFARAVVADIQSKACVNPKRIYATGMSNGGYLSHRLACEASDLFAAVAPVASVLAIPAAECKPARPISVIHFHGTADTLVAYNGGSSSISAPDSFAGWASRNGCTDTASESFNKGNTKCTTHKACKDGVSVTLCTVTDGGHCWFGTEFCPFGKSTLDISANDEMWNVFEKSKLP